MLQIYHSTWQLCCGCVTPEISYYVHVGFYNIVLMGLVGLTVWINGTIFMRRLLFGIAT